MLHISGTDAWRRPLREGAGPMPNLMKAKSLINNRVRNSEGAFARPYTVAGQHGFVTRLAIPACDARSAELRTRIRCKRVGDTNEEENAHQNKDAQGVCRVIVSPPPRARLNSCRFVRPPPSRDFWAVNAVLVCIVSARDLLVAEPLLGVAPNLLQRRGPVNHVHCQAKSVGLVIDRQLHRSIDIPFLLVTPHVQRLVLAAICQAVNQPGISVEIEDDWLVNREQRIEVPV